MSHTLQLLLLLAFIIAAAKLAGAAANRIGQPAVFGELLAGLLLGPTLANMLGWPIFAHAAAPVHGETASLLAIVRDLAEVGVILLMFIAGMETDVNEMRRVGKVAFWSAAGGVALPMAGGIATAAAFGFPVLWEGIFIGTILTATSVSISAQTLIELRALKSKTGSTILGAAVIDDVIGIVILSVVVALSRASEGLDIGSLVLVVVRMAIYFVGAIYFLRVALPPMARFAERLGVSQGLLAFTLAIAFVAAWAAEYVGGVAAITGAYLAGVMLAQTQWREQIDHGIHPLTYSMFVPVFFISIGLQANGRELGEQVLFTIALVIVAILAKAVGCGVFAWFFGFTPRESAQVGAGMISRGEVGLIVAGYGLANGIITPQVFSASVIMVLATTMVTPPLLRLTFPRAPAGAVPRRVEETIGGPPAEADEDRGGPHA
jgi:Kef-type K+ transport system membrane component KefB